MNIVFSIPVKLLIFLSGFIPLALSVFVGFLYSWYDFILPTNLNEYGVANYSRWIPCIILLTITIVPVIIINYRMSSKGFLPKKKGVDFIVKNVRLKSNIQLTSCYPYLFPFILATDFEFGDFSLLLVLFMYMTILFLMVHKQFVLFMNPFIIIMGYCLFRCKLENKNDEIFETYILTKNNISVGDKISTGLISEDLLLEL